ncbi:MAG: type II toxin-antitoxin system VapC family toxin [Candidatus Dormibacteraeota bacterium]|nr:type II toxin-antitoxin system VapC family toxin [Candidatus Dormibacteraeota bacterium]
MILDTSAILAIVFREPERDDFLRKIGSAGTVGVGAPTLVETSIVLRARLGEQGRRWLDLLVERAELVVVPFEAAHAHLAMDAWLRFGRGRHPAALNLGDCLAYATARAADRPLLCKSEDFKQTDLALA